MNAGRQSIHAGTCRFPLPVFRRSGLSGAHGVPDGMNIPFVPRVRVPELCMA